MVLLPAPLAPMMLTTPASGTLMVTSFTAMDLL